MMLKPASPSHYRPVQELAGVRSIFKEIRRSGIRQEMKTLSVPEPVSGGIILSYECNARCRHCMYGCSPGWRADWMSETDAEIVLAQLSDKLGKAHSFRAKAIGVNYGMHFTGGEPFLNFDLLLAITKKALALNICPTFAETNGFWCTNDKKTEEWLKALKSAGLQGMLVSANPFILEWVPFERTERAIEKSRKIFGKKNVIVYQELFCHHFKRMNVKGTMRFETYMEEMQKGDLLGLYQAMGCSSVIPMGRATYSLSSIYRKYVPNDFFGQSCREELTRPWHIHIDNYCNYMTGYCAGISLGDARDIDAICRGIDLDEYPILHALTSDLEQLYQYAVAEWGYEASDEDYVSKCHLCVDIRRHVALQTDQFKELRPREFYYHLHREGDAKKELLRERHFTRSGKGNIDRIPDGNQG